MATGAPSRLADAAADGDRPRVFGSRPYLPKRDRAVLNQLAATVHRRRPDYVDDPDHPGIADLVDAARRGDADGNAVAARWLFDLLWKGLTYQEAVVWVLVRELDLDANDVYYVTAAPVNDDGRRIQTGGHAADRRNAQRTLQAVLTSAAHKLDQPVPDVDGLDPDGV